MPLPDNTLLCCEAVEKSFAGVLVLKGVSLDVARGEMVCIAGENGAGKSTLMNIIGGVHQPDTGSMRLAGEPYRPADPRAAARAGIAFVHQELNLFPNLSATDNIFLTDYPERRVFGVRLTDRARAERHAGSLLEEVGLAKPPRTLVEELSHGDRQLVEIAKALHADAKLIIFDEPTTSLTSRETDRLFAIIRSLRRRGIGVLYISHALDHVLALADRVLVLRDGAAVASGPRSDFTMDSLIRAMVGRPIEQLYPPRSQSSDSLVVLEVKEVSESGVIENISFRVCAGEILGVAGLMGSGRSELARIVFGLDRAAKGSIVLDGEAIDALPPRERIRRGLAFVTESRRDDGLFMDASLEENLQIVHPRAADAGGLLREFRVVHKDSKRQRLIELSGGNQQKVAMAKWLAVRPRVLILDEPTRGIDIGAKQEIYNLIVRLAAEGVALVLISSEIEELVGLCHRILVMARGEVRGEFPGGASREEIMRAAV